MNTSVQPACERPTTSDPGCSLDRLVLRWPAKIRREIGEWLGGALCGHGSQMSKPAMRRWRYLLKKLEAQNAAGQWRRDQGHSA
ncbi:MAG: hypothetical protein NT154_00520 [Verrucomicrobia bacterium]|nr:hypothetical protein [Verrucomicrobiota bacterium]